MIFNILPESYDVYFNKLNFSSLIENQRVFGTFGLFKYLSIPDWFFGVGINRMVEFLSGHNVLQTSNYANSLVFLVFSFGIVGALTWSVLCVIMYKRIDANYKVMLVYFTIYFSE